MPPARLTVLVVSSSGGVLLDVLALRPWLQRHSTTWAVVAAADTTSALAGERVRWVQERPGSTPWRLLPGVVEAVRVLRAERPQVVVSAGTGVAVGFFLVARLKRIPTMWIDTFNIVAIRGRAARLCARIASVVLVQRDTLVGPSPKTVCVGELY